MEYKVKTKHNIFRTTMQGGWVWTWVSSKGGWKVSVVYQGCQSGPRTDQAQHEDDINYDMDDSTKASLSEKKIVR
jgi:hypothetical protein